MADVGMGLDLRVRMRRGEHLVGLFSKLIQPEAAELMVETGLDFLILDIEHGTHSRTDLSRYVFAAQALGLPVLVRLPDDSEPWIQHAVSVGAAGLIVSHIHKVERVKEACLFARGMALQRAYAGMGRRSNYRRKSWSEFERTASDGLIFVAQIDEPAGATIAAEVAAMDGVDGLFLGSLGMALAMGEQTPRHPDVDEVLAAICAVGRAAGKCVGVHVMQPEQQSLWLQRGARMAVVGSDYALLRDGAISQAAGFRKAAGLNGLARG